MAYVTSLFARKMVAAAGRGIDQRATLERAGIDPDAPWDPKVMIAATTYYEMLEGMAEQIDVTELPVHVGASMRCDEYGALGLAWKAAPTLKASCSRVDRYARIWTGVVTYELRNDTRGILFMLHREGERRLGLRLSNEATLASAVSLSRQVCPVPFSPVEVLIQHKEPKSKVFHEAWFGCPVHFGADLDAVLISHEAMERPNILGDEGISRYLMSDLDTQLTKLKTPPQVVGDARNAIAQALNEGTPRVADIAKGLGMSARSFHRRLSEHGLSFQTLTEETRRELAEGLLRDEQYSLAEVAFLTGFSEQSSFTRAFKRWLGTTPAHYRKAKLMNAFPTSQIKH
ncbi:AraC family transcriptional regulator [Roseobacter sp. OBYS 0001]|uniref:AraC family transcriptional regulator n=1 Tax=Roseobacter sp. OBYS 0001 TaxID=882651 RepID=UPI001BBDC34C|nr:AraC family transcriptional regulator [Roseobacter sp. OBYS 0001]GIT86609.1 AraC family transcriptional regulator [Roseobacter sp. OBYS 0001]